MGERISLQIGQRYALKQESMLLQLLSGEADVYAVSKTKEQIFLQGRQAGDWLYYLADNQDGMELELLVKEETELELYLLETEDHWAGLDTQVVSGMLEWLYALWQLGWMQRERMSLLELMETAALNVDMEEDYSQDEAAGPLFANWLTDKWSNAWVKAMVGQSTMDVAVWQQTALGYALAGQELAAFCQAQQRALAIMLNVYLQDKTEKKEFRARWKKHQTARLMEMSTDLLLGQADYKHTDAQVAANVSGIGRLVLKALEHFKMDMVDLSLSRYVQDTLRGDDLLKLLLAKANIRYRKIYLGDDWYKRDSGTIFLTIDNELVLAEPVSETAYRIHHADGSCEPLTKELATHISREFGWLLYASLPQRKLTIKDLFRFVYQQSWRADIVAVLLVSFAAGLIPLLTPIITDKLFSDIIPVHDYSGVTTITQVMVVAAFTTAMLSFVRGLAVQRLNIGGGMALDAAIWSRLLSLPMSFFKKYSAGELNQRMLSLETLKGLFSTKLVAAVFNCIFSIWSLLLMLYYSWRLTLLAVVIWAIYLLLSWAIYYRQPKLTKEMVEAENKNSSLLVQIFAGLAKFRSRGGEEHAFYLWARSYSQQWQKRLKMRWLSNYSTVLNSILSIIMMMALFYYDMELAKKADTAVKSTDFLAFFSAYSGFNGAVLGMVPMAASFIGASAYGDNLKPILEAVPEEQGDKPDIGKLRGEIDLQDVSFSYVEGRNVLKHINLHVAPGESLAIVGPSGCGKSTLLRLLLGFERPSQGVILFDRINLDDVSIESVRRQMGVVLQDGRLLSGSIKQNIVGNQNLTEDDAWAAAAKAGLEKDIQAFPMHMETVISEDAGNISGGQKQRILLARSMAGSPAIMVLDEATSALDNVTQAIVTDSLDKMTCTRIVVAHRLSTIKNAEHIVVLDQGSIVEEGSYAELMAKDGFFAKLAKRQIA